MDPSSTASPSRNDTCADACGPPAESRKIEVVTAFVLDTAQDELARHQAKADHELKSAVPVSSHSSDGHSQGSSKGHPLGEPRE